ncbi:MAG: hypothetical protein KF886_22065 [Candidatus Hydrogenedentes bacterium]|nr:hypothetical protein [Candidatus Hydrogenedentota bacterium]
MPPAVQLLPHFVLLALFTLTANADPPVHTLTMFPAEHKVIEDPKTGATLTFLTTDPGSDTNLYFHEYAWTADGSIILFYSGRENGGLMGYLTATGELFTFRDTVGGLGGATAALTGNGLYALRDASIIRLDFEVTVSEDPAATPSIVRARERHIAALPKAERFTALGENCAGTTLAVGVQDGEVGPVPAILTIDIASGTVRELCRAPESPAVVQHVQWSHTDPHVLSYAGRKPRLMVVDTRIGHPKAVYPEWADELVTHESWWVEDQIIFCGGTNPPPTEDSHVKLFDTRTGVVRIIGAGAWWAGATPEELSRYNWWHADGSDDGRWVVADNWHGDIILFEGKTTRPRMLTLGHRTYGTGTHPHVGFDRAGKSVIFTSHLLGDENVCVATIPDSWQRENPS